MGYPMPKSNQIPWLRFGILCIFFWIFTPLGLVYQTITVPDGHVAILQNPLIKENEGRGFTKYVVQSGTQHVSRFYEYVLVDVRPHTYTIPILAHGVDNDLKFELEVEYSIRPDGALLQEELALTTPDQGRTLTAENIFRLHCHAIVDYAAQIAANIAKIDIDSPQWPKEEALDKYMNDSLKGLEDSNHRILEIRGARLNCVEITPCETRTHKKYYHHYVLPGLGQGERPR